MNTIKIFIASSAELKPERNEIVDLIQDIKDELEKQGVKLSPVLWEYMDSSMRDGRKEDEYLSKLKECEICIVLFWRTIGEYTLEELNVAEAERQAGRHPQKVYMLFKETTDEITPELTELKANVSNIYPGIPSVTFDCLKTLRECVAKTIIDRSIE